jgi:hypothetical protein
MAMTRLLASGDPRRNVVLVTLLGLTTLDRDTAVATVVEKLLKSSDVPVFVTDDLDLSIFLQARRLYEYLPSISTSFEHIRSGWDQYIVRKMQIILRKWEPAETLVYGLSMESYVEQMRSVHHRAATRN